MLIRLLGTLVQGSNRIGSRQVTHPSKGHMGVNMSSFWQNTVFLQTLSIFFFFLSLCLLFPWNDYAICHMLGRYPLSNKNGIRYGHIL